MPLIYPTAAVCGEDAEGDTILRCPTCGWEGVIDAWDCLRADRDNLFCTRCYTECQRGLNRRTQMTVQIEGRAVEHVEKEYPLGITEAVAKFREEHPGFDIEAINGEAVIGWCESCGCPLFEPSEYYIDADVAWCKSHVLTAFTAKK